MLNKKSNHKITWGVIGVGDVCEKKSVPAMYKTEGSTVKTVMRRNREKAKDYARRHRVPNFTDDAREIFTDPDIDIVYIATPPSDHREYAIRAASAGKPAYVEKPMATSYSECIEMNRVFDEANLPLFVAYYRRTLPNFLKIQHIIEEGLIGKVRTVNILMNKELYPDNVRQLDYNWRVIPEIAGGGYFYDLASHQLDFLDFLFGPVTRARGMADNQAGIYEAEDVVSGSFQFKNGVIGSGLWCFTAGSSADTDRTVIVGSKGYIEYATFEDARVKLVTDQKGEEIFPFVLPENIQQILVQTVIDELMGKGKCPSTGESAARTNWVMEQLAKLKV